MPTAILNIPGSGVFAGISGALHSAGFSPVPSPPAGLLISCAGDADAGIASARAFAEAVPPDQEALIVNILPAYARGDWGGARRAALLWAFTRHAALEWAPRRIRVNALGLGVFPALPDQLPEEAGRAAGAAPAAPATPEDVAATILAMWRFPSMTGQLIRLGS